MTRPRIRPAVVALGLVACAPSVEPGDVQPTMRILGGALLSELGPFHLRVFAKSSSMRCDVGTGQVLVNGRRDLTALPGRNVQPAERCGADWARLASTYGTATPVDQCITGTTNVRVPPGTYVVLVHGQGSFRLSTGEMRSGIRGSGCAEVTLGEGATSDITLRVFEQVDDRARCGDSVLDSNESCDLGMQNGAEGSGCSARCQTAERAVNVANNGVGNQRAPSLAWSASRGLFAGFEVEGVAEEDVRVRYLDPEGNAITTPSAFAVDVLAGGGPSQQRAVSLAPAPTLMGYVAAWETLASPANVVVEAFDNNIPRDLTPPRYVAVPVAPASGMRRTPSVAVAGSRVAVVWREGDVNTGPVRAVTFALAMPLGAPTAAVTVATTAAGAPRVAAMSDGSFVVVWSAAGDVFARRLTGAGALQGAEVLVSPVSAQVQDQPAVAAAADGTAVVAWRDAAPDAVDGSGTTVRWARIGPTLAVMGAARTAPTTTAGDQARPAVAVSAGATPTVLVAWEDTTTRHVRGRLARLDGAEVFARLGGSTRDFQVSEAEGARAPSAAAGGGRLPQFAVAWEGADADGAGVRMRVFPQ